MTLLFVDFETACLLDIKEVGAHTYARHLSCEVLMLAWAFGNGPVRVWVPDGPWDYDSLPERISDHIAAGGKVAAHNAEFEWVIFQHVLGITIPPEQLIDTAALALVHGYPKSLDGASRAMGLMEEKDTRGGTLIRKFCVPRKPSKNNPEIWNDRHSHPEEWEEFIEYCRQDVIVEREIWRKLGSRWPLKGIQQWVYEETYRINERGLPCDILLAKRTLHYLKGYNRRRTARCNELTHGLNPTQRDKLLAWLQLYLPNLKSLQRLELEHVLAEEKNLPPNVEDVIKIRLEQGRVSTKKLIKMLAMDSGDARARGSFVYHGAGPGRFVALGLQPHNFQRPTIKDVDGVIHLLKTDPFAIEEKYPDVLEAVGSTMRGFFKAPSGKLLVVADYSAIEARVLAWLAGQRDLVRLFHKGIDIYIEMASYIFKLPMEEIAEGHAKGILKYEAMRKLGKDTILGCGYNMGVLTFLLQMENKGSDDIAGISFREDKKYRGSRDRNDFTVKAWNMASKAVYGYRERYNKIVDLWNSVEKAAMFAIRNPGEVFCYKRLAFKKDGNFLKMRLPSGRKICYPYAEIYKRQNPWYPERIEQVIRFRTINSKNQWVWEDIYGGKMTENAVQGVAADLLMHGIYQATQHGFEVVGSVHDEIMALFDLVENRDVLAREFERIICILPAWAKGNLQSDTIPLRAEGYVAERFRK